MKRIRDIDRYQRNQSRAERRSLKRRTRPLRGAFSGRLKLRRGRIKEIKIAAPAVFSLVDNTDETMVFFSKLELYGSKKEVTVYIDLMHVSQMTIDAVLLLISKIKKLSKCVNIGGNEPRDEKVRRVLTQSGFYSHVSVKPAGYHSEENKGILSKHTGKRVREDICSQIIHFATRKVYGAVQKNGGLYRALIECMANTRDHARIGLTDTEAWWVAVYFDEDSKIAQFVFLDNGVGIFKSARLRSALQHLAKHFNILSHNDILIDLLDNNLGSRTGLPYRGKGLPAIKRALERGQIRNLKIVTNGTRLDVSARKAKTLQKSFRGTCLTWEIHP